MKAQAARDVDDLRRAGQRLKRAGEQRRQQFQQARRARSTGTTAQPANARPIYIRWVTAMFRHPVWRWVVVTVGGFALFVALTVALFDTIRNLGPW